MKEKLSILLVEDDSLACIKLADIIERRNDMILVGFTAHADKALEYIKDELPDVMILDLELHQGSGSGIEIMNRMREMKLPVRPYILITTNNSSNVTYQIARELGADYIMSKHQENYSEKYVIDFLRIVAPAIKENKNSAAAEKGITESPSSRDNRIKRRIITELGLVGISQKSVGFKYLTEAILINIKEPTQNVSSVIGKKYGKTESSVERAMQNAINRAWATCCIDDLMEYYTAKTSSAKGVPTLTEFIFYYVNKLTTEY